MSSHRMQTRRCAAIGTLAIDVLALGQGGPSQIDEYSAVREYQQVHNVVAVCMELGNGAIRNSFASQTLHFRSDCFQFKRRGKLWRADVKERLTLSNINTGKPLVKRLRSFTFQV